MQLIKLKPESAKSAILKTLVLKISNDHYKVLTPHIPSIMLNNLLRESYTVSVITCFFVVKYVLTCLLLANDYLDCPSYKSL